MIKTVAYNPILPLDVYIADGEPHVFNDRLYLFGSHDKEGGDTFCMLDYQVWSAPTDDLSNWSSSPNIYQSNQDPGYTEDRKFMFAPDVVRGNDGRFYLYYCLAGWKGKGGYDGPISVAVSYDPDGPYTYHGFVRHVDGTVFSQGIPFDPALINDEGVIRLYYGTTLPKGLELNRSIVKLFAKLFAGIYGKRPEDFKRKELPWGAFTVELENDMLTVKGNANRILPSHNKGTDFQSHVFFEGSSIRKIGDHYYFIYSSQKNHELCYATSEYPDRDFRYGGVIISNGDVGIEGRKERQRVNATGTNHGSIIQIQDRWYVFYHRLTHACDYSRQACAERIWIDQNGKIAQVALSSQGLSAEPLLASGIYPAVIACQMTHNHMPHISNRIWNKPIPCVSHDKYDRFIHSIQNNTRIVFKSFTSDNKSLKVGVMLRGTFKGELKIYLNETCIGDYWTIPLDIRDNDHWLVFNKTIHLKQTIFVLCLHFIGRGNLDCRDLSFSDSET